MTPNKQIPIKSDRQETILVHSVFYTLQGEGPFAGEPCVFLRLAGCNLQCPECDTEYSEGAERMEPSRAAALIDEAFRIDFPTIVPVWAKQRHPLVVISGGEPFRQSIGPVARFLLAKGYRVQVETNGTLYDEDFPYGHPRVTVVCSPKAGKVNKQLEPHIAAYKYVVSAANRADWDGLPTSALGLTVPPARPLRPGTPVFVNPLDSHDDSENAANLQAAASVCLAYGYRMGIQLHKLLNLE